MDKTTKQKVEEILGQIRPHLQADGGDIQLVEITEDNVVRVELRGACGSCPHSAITLKQGVETTLKRYVPEVKSVEDVNLSF
jgi:Fe-S cluster biogenesis protein NfuA